MTAPPDGELTRDGFLGGRIHLWQPRVGYRAAIDPVLLAAAMPVAPGARVLDLGCGAGTAALCLGARVPGLALYGLEVQPEYAALARRNAAENGQSFAVEDGDLRQMPPALRALDFDAVLMNPPFHDAAAAAPAMDAGRDIAHREGPARLGDWLAAGLRRLRPGGVLVVVHRAARLGAILGAIEGPAGAVEVLPVAPRAGAAAQRVLVRARKGSRAQLILYPSFVLHTATEGRDGAAPYSPEADVVLRQGSELLFNAI